MTDAKSYRHRFPMTIIQHAIWLSHRFPLSYRDVQEMLRQRGIELSHRVTDAHEDATSPRNAARMVS